tara:strand:- start:4209 stop:4490 length:282 start_codon:yes stop_codon:yes gene_type:complete
LNKKEIFSGILAGLFASTSSTIFLTLILSNSPIEDTWEFMYKQGKLTGLISLGALINLFIFIIAIRKNKTSFAAGLVIISLLIVLLIGIIKLI